MNRRNFLLTSAASVVTVLVPLPAVGKAIKIHKGGVVIGTGTITNFGAVMDGHINCRCVISPELAGRRARYEVSGTLSDLISSDEML